MDAFNLSLNHLIQDCLPERIENLLADAQGQEQSSQQIAYPRAQGAGEVHGFEAKLSVIAKAKHEKPRLKIICDALDRLVVECP